MSQKNDEQSVKDDKYDIVLFDGVCNLCNFWINWLIGKDQRRKFRYAALQSAGGHDLLKKTGKNPNLLASVVLIQDGRIYTESTAVIRIAKRLGGWFSLMQLFMIIPGFIRNAIYRLIAKNRYKWFGERNTCRIPTKEEQSLFLSDDSLYELSLHQR